MVRGATGFLLACTLWSGALVLAALNGGPDPADDVGAISDDPALDLITVHDEALADTRRVRIEEEPDEGGEQEQAKGSGDDEVDLRWWEDGLDDDPDPGPADLEDVPLGEDELIDDLDDWLRPTDGGW